MPSGFANSSSTLPQVVEAATDTTRWGDKLVFRVGDAAVGGKKFAQIDFVQDGRAVLSFVADPEIFHELIERDGLVPAPYRARLHGGALLRWDALGDPVLNALLRTASDLTFATVPKKTRVLLA